MSECAICVGHKERKRSSELATCRSDLLAAFDDAAAQVAAGLRVDHGADVLFLLQIKEELLVALRLLPAEHDISCVTLRTYDVAGGRLNLRWYLSEFRFISRATL